MRLNLSEARQEFGRLSRERRRLEQEVVGGLSRKKLIAGTPVEKYKACNKGNCKCTRGELHGPTYYVSRKEGGKTKMIYIRRGLWPKVEEKIKRYQRWRFIRARIVKINADLIYILDRMEKAVTDKPEGEKK